MDYNKAALEMHESHKGKVGIVSKVEVATRDDLSTAYTPGVAEPCRKIKANPEDVYKYTFKGNMVAVVSNGTAVLGLGDIGPEAGHGGQGGAVQGVRRGGCLPHLHQRPQCRRSDRSLQGHCAYLRRHQSGGYQEPRVL